MMIRKFFCPLLLLAGGLTVQPASAATILITYTGTVSYGMDTTGVFGTAATDLTGKAFTSVYTLNYPTFGAADISGTTYHETQGGAFFNNASPQSAQITINGVTKSLSGAYSGVHLLQTLPGKFSMIFDNAGTDGQNTINNSVSTDGNDVINSLNFSDPVSYNLKFGDYGYGAFQFGHLFDSDPVNDAIGDLKTLSVKVESVGAVPEPATWALLLMGFAMVGATLRIRRREPALT